jgi:CHAT domain-containing protein/Tfp pilus assembly protein PilF
MLMIPRRWTCLLCCLALLAVAAAPPGRLTPRQRVLLGRCGRLAGAMEASIRGGNLPEATETGERLRALQRDLLGPTHPALISTLSLLTALHEVAGAYEQAAERSRELIAVLEGQKGSQYWEVIDERLSLERRLRLVKVTAAGREKLVAARTQRNRAFALLQLGRPDRAVSAMGRALALSKEALGEKHPDHATTLNELAVLYQQAGESARALALLKEARRIYAEALGEKHADYATCLNNLASVYQTMSDFARALPLIEKAVAIYQEALGEGHPRYAQALNNLAYLHHLMGELERALPLYQKAEALLKQTRGEDHIDCARCSSNLAGVYLEMGKLDKALPLYRKALAIIRDSLGEAHPDYATSLNNLAFLYHAMGKHDRALPLYQQALKLVRKSRGEKHADYATSLQNLGALHAAGGDHAKALELLEQASKLYRDALGDRHPRYADGLTGLAWTCWMRGETARAEKLLTQSLDIQLHHLDDTFSALSERQRLALLERTRHSLNEYLAVGIGTRRPAGELYGRVLAWKGMATARQAEEALRRDSPALAGLLADLRAARAGLARLAIGPSGPGDRAAWLERLRDLEQKKEKLEGKLALESAAFRASREVSAAAVARALPADTVLVDLTEYVHWSPPAGKVRAWHDERRLLAFVVRREGDPVLVELGAAKTINDAIKVWRESLGSSASSRKAGEELRQRVWLPIEKHLGKASTVLVAADGQLALLPLGALPGSKKDTYLIEERAIAHVPSGRFLLHMVAPQKPARASLLALGGLDFGKPGRWPDLPGSRAEVRQVESTFRAGVSREAPVQVLQGLEGSRAALLRGTGKQRWRYVHLATHAYFDAPRPLRDRAGAPGGPLRPEADELIYKESPLLLSGVVLAGANRDPAEGKLTAEEVCSLDLRGCELVVLSACETALGKVEAGEGVLGLQRAFHLAGAAAVISSLWGVHDEATQRLMQRFYAHLWGKGRPTKLEALRRAQLEMLREGVRDEVLVRGVSNPKTGAGKRRQAPVKDAGGRLAPAYWAAFVLSGDWR